MAIIAVKMTDQEYVECDLDPDKGKETATKWAIGCLDSRVIGKLKDEATSFSVNPTAPEDEVDVSVGQNDLYYLACRFGLKGWTNFKMPDGSDARYRTSKKNFAGRTYEVVTDECLSLIPQPVIADLGRKIIALNEVTEVEVKN